MNDLNDSKLLDANRNFYEPLWRDCRLVEPQHFNTWPLVSPMLAKARNRLEVAPGLRPRLPIAGTQFVDISMQALTKLASHGGIPTLAPINSLPFADHTFDLLCALDIIEHVDDDDRAMAEIARVTTKGATLLLSTPLHPDMWTYFDDFVGHRRRYEPQQIRTLLLRHGFTIKLSAVFGMKPRPSIFLDFGLWFLKHRRARAMWWYNRVMPFTVRRQKPLHLHEGLINTDAVGEILLVCKQVDTAYRH
ncbi:MAG: class I SAM-dependent methyltransferase [Desulfobacterales bacterium]|nr:class I SAM-dependent methyltransferase [Desulfobacterales bacterium]